MLLPYIVGPENAATFSITYGAAVLTPAGEAVGLAAIAGPGLSAFNHSALFCPAFEEYELPIPARVYGQCGYGMQKQPLNSAPSQARGRRT